jgi:hypothetical protein
MPYKKRLVILGSSAIFLAVVYAATLFFDPANMNARNERFTWLPAGAREKADKIEIGSELAGDKTELVLRGGKWYALLETDEVPVKQGRIDDLFRLLGTRGAFPRRGSSSSSHETVGLGTNAYRIVIKGGAGLPLLDLLVGSGDSSGNSVFLRRFGENEFRSGDKLIGSYIAAEKTSWYDLKLFDDINLSAVQRVRVTFSGYTGPEDETPLIGYMDYNIARSGDNWVMDSTTLDRDKVETWIQTILEAVGETILPSGNSAFDATARIYIETGNGANVALQIGELSTEDKAFASVTGKPYVYVLPRWTVTRLLRERGYFPDKL